MSKLRLLPWAGAVAMVALVASGTGTARADEIFFGNILPSSGIGAGGCTHATGDGGFVCVDGQTFSAEGSTFTAHGFSGPTQFATSANLTWKPINTGGVSNAGDESGLGENFKGPGNPCDDNQTSTVCEIQPGASVTVSSTIAMNDVLIGSVQSVEKFQVWYGTGSTPDTQLDGTFTGSGSALCGHPDGAGAEECLLTLPSTTKIVGLFGVANTGQASDTLISAVSLVPAPPIGHGLAVLLAVGGMLFGAKLWGRGKTRLPLGAA